MKYLYFIKQQFILAAVLLITIQVNAQTQITDTTQKIIAGRYNTPEQMDKPYVILISADGFRSDLADKFDAKTLKKLRKSGIEAAFLQSVYPSLTFPNHYSIATGLYPGHHGIVTNYFFDRKKNAFYKISDRKQVNDPSWYGGEPIWVTAEKQHMVTASFYWVGSEAPIEGFYPTYYYNYNEKINIDTRIATVRHWLELPKEKRPHLITFYFPEVDHAEHKTGTESSLTRSSVQFIDSSIRKMVETLSDLKLKINYIFVSDHGMINVDTSHTLSLPEQVDTSKFIVAGEGPLVMLYAKQKGNDAIALFNQLKKQANPDYDIYLHNSIPSRWHFGGDDDKAQRIGDLLLVPHMPKSFTKTPLGQHGFDPALKEMHATFYSWGPAFKRHLKIKGFENINIYPLIANILGLHYDPQLIDGKAEVLAPILK